MQYERRVLRYIYEELQPRKLLLYAGKPGRDHVMSTWPGEVVWVPTRNVVLKEKYGKNEAPAARYGSTKEKAARKRVAKSTDEDDDAVE